ncbi:MAG: TonB-dependent receptor, partial [Bryobacteraceae bacterium]|nr:TonB-dependent receptor [Bryobacteraceae bacterium]
PVHLYGNPADSHAGARVHLGSALLEWQLGQLLVRNRTLAGDYDRGYQNFVPGAVMADRRFVSISAYNSSTHRRNVFNQTDLVTSVQTGRVRHSLLAGFEAGRQRTFNLRNTGYFNGSSTTVLVPYSQPLVTDPLGFRQSATDANNRVSNRAVSGYLQDQVELTRRLRAVLGLRLESFDLRHHNQRNGEVLSRTDRLVSPRAGLVWKPRDPVSIYGSFSVAYLPSSGDQFAALTSVTQQMKPEKFTNYEVGLKWDLARGLTLTSALYRLDRTNTRAVDPNDPGRILQTGSQRSNGFELGWNGVIGRGWSVAGGYGWQDVYIRTDTAAARAGLKAAQAPRHTLSLWNHYQLHPRLGLALGVVARSAMFAAVDNAVTLPGYATADAAAFFSLSEALRLQVNVDNLTGRTYYMNAHNNTNISPGRPRSARVGLTARF